MLNNFRHVSVRLSMLAPSLVIGSAFAQGPVAPCVASWSNAIPGFDAFDNFEPTEHSARIFDLAVFDEDGPGPDAPSLFACGWFNQVNGLPAYAVAKWNGQSWSDLGFDVRTQSNCLDAFNCAPALDMIVWNDGAGEALYVAGGTRLSQNNGLLAATVMKWDGQSWSVPAPNRRTVVDLVIHDDGTGEALYAIYDDLDAIGIDRLVNGLWTPYPNPPVGIAVFEGAVSFDDGSGPAIWFGGSFIFQVVIPGKPLPETLVENIAAVRPDGTFILPSGGVAGDGVNKLAVWDPDGDGAQRPQLVVGGNLFGANLVDTTGFGGVDTPLTDVVNVASWDGLTWRALGDNLPPFSPITRFLVVPQPAGDLLFAATSAADQFLAVEAAGVYQFDGNQWTKLGGAFSSGRGGLSVNGGISADANGLRRFRLELGVHALAMYDDGSGPSLIAGGDFEFTAGVRTRSIAALDAGRMPGDANADFQVNFNDIVSVLSNWLAAYITVPGNGTAPSVQGPGSGPGDANLDGLVTFNDITSILSNWNQSCTP